MPVKIRLTRQGKKRYPYYHIVVADSRAPRDGKNIDRLGAYNPNTNPATIEIDFDRALNWLQRGAQPTDTCRAILSYRGILYKKHLLEGVKKGAFSEEDAEKKFDTWMKAKEEKINANIEKIEGEKDEAYKKRIELEKKKNDERMAELAKAQEAEQKAKEGEKAAAEAPKEEATESDNTSEATEQALAEEAKAEEPKKEEPKAEEPKAEEAPKKEEAKAEEAPKEEAPAEKKKDSE